MVQTGSRSRAEVRKLGGVSVAVTCAVFLLLAAPCTAAGIDFEHIRATKRIAATKITEPIVINGKFDEAAWKQAQPATGFYQQQPEEGRQSTEPSEVRFLYDDHSLYVGGTFFDSEPEHGPITNELKRDFSINDGDLVTLELDTFHDGRNAFNFMTNPAGAQYDSQSYDDGRQNNQNWDGVWFVKTSRSDNGWTMEMEIPFRTLRFPDTNVQEWGMNVFRLIRRKNEITAWSPVPRQFNQFKVSYAGTLAGLSGIRPGRNLRLKPFLTSQVSRGLSLDDSGWSGKADAGFDFKYTIGTSLVADATYRTDFSQVEADTQQINLTRFSLFFPEKREFFLENQGAFRVGDQDAPGGAGRKDLIPFFSRRIGLSNGQPIPIIGGTRLTGKAGSYGIGALFMATEASGGQPSQRFTALRVSREVGQGSSIGGFYVGRNSSLDSNAAVGGDVHLNIGHSKDIDAYIIKSHTPGVSGRDWAGRAALSISENTYAIYTSYTNIAPNYRNDVGFVSREDIAWFAGEYDRFFRPQATSRVVRQYTLILETQTIATSAHSQMLTRMSRIGTTVNFQNSSRFDNDLIWNCEYLTQPFEISKGVVLPPGRYPFQQVVPAFTSDKSRWLSGNVALTLGEFYSGHIAGATGAVRVRMNEHIAASATFGRDVVHLPQGAFTATLTGLRLDWSFSTRMFLNAFVQYDSASEAWRSNVRFNLIHRPLSDIYVVFDDTRSSTQVPVRAFVFKYTHMLAF